MTPEQKAKWEAVRKEYEPKFKGADKMESILTEEQKKARDEAFKMAAAAGKYGKEMWDAAQAAMKLTDEQKAKLSDAQKEVGALYKEMTEKITAFLTPEQKEKLRSPLPAKEEKKPEEMRPQQIEIDDDK